MIFDERSSMHSASLECGDLSPLCPVRLVNTDKTEPLNAVLVGRQVARRQSGDKSPHSKA